MNAFISRLEDISLAEIAIAISALLTWLAVTNELQRAEEDMLRKAFNTSLA